MNLSKTELSARLALNRDGKIKELISGDVKLSENDIRETIESVIE